MEKKYCPSCGFMLMEHDHAWCPECGWKSITTVALDTHIVIVEEYTSIKERVIH